jgi:hypothetical protein
LSNHPLVQERELSFEIAKIQRAKIALYTSRNCPARPDSSVLLQLKLLEHDPMGVNPAAYSAIACVIIMPRGFTAMAASSHLVQILFWPSSCMIMHGPQLVPFCTDGWADGLMG